jgi:hypothetical protein
VPIQTDYSDLYDTFAFFMGVPGVNGTTGHDEMAEKIAAQAREFSARHWRWEDMQVYVSSLVSTCKLGAFGGLTISTTIGISAAA